MNPQSSVEWHTRRACFLLALHIQCRFGDGGTALLHIFTQEHRLMATHPLKPRLNRLILSLNSSSRGLLARIRQVLHFSHRGTEKWGRGQVDTCWAVNVPNTADLFIFIWLWHQRDLDTSKSAREQAIHSSVLGWYSTCMSESLGSSFKRHMPGPSWATDSLHGVRDPAHLSIAIPASAQNRKKECPSVTHWTWAKGLARHLYPSPCRWRETERFTALLSCSTHTWPVPPEAQSVAVMNPASERRRVLSLALPTHQGPPELEEGG